jgi:hypothetical protein
MAYKSAVTRIEAHHIIAVHHIQPHRSPSPEDLRRAFEKAMIEIHQADFPAGEPVDKKVQYRSPIVQRAKRLGISQARAEECALSDAARALALLWKI